MKNLRSTPLPSARRAGFEKQREQARELRRTLTDPAKRSQLAARTRQDHPAVWEVAQLDLVAALLRAYDPRVQARIVDAFMDHYLRLLSACYFWAVGNPHGDLRAFLLTQPPQFALPKQRVRPLSRYAQAVNESFRVYDMLRKESLPRLPRQTPRAKQLMRRHGVSRAALLEAQGKILERRAKGVRTILRKLPGFSRIPPGLLAQWARLPQKDIALAAVAWKYGVRRSTVKR